MLGNFNPSEIIDEIFTIMDDYETEGMGIYNYGVTDAIIDYLANYVKVEWLCNCSVWPNGEGGICSIGFVDNGHPQLVVFEYRY